METAIKTNNSPVLVSSSSVCRQCPATTKPSFFKPIPSSSTTLKIKPLSISIKPNSSYSIYNTLLPIIKNPKSNPKTMLISSSPIPILRTSLIKALAAVTVSTCLPSVKFGEDNESNCNQFAYLESSKSIFTHIIKESPLLSNAYNFLLQHTSPLDSYYELEIVKAMIEKKMNSKDLKSANQETFIGFLLMNAFYHKKMGNYKESFRIYDGLETKYPQDHRVYLCKGVLHTFLKEEDEADECFQKYMSLVQNDDPCKSGFDNYMNTAKAYFAQLENY